MRATRRREAGISLLEVLVAIAIVVIAVLGLLAALPLVLAQSRTSRETQIATSAIRSKIDEMRGARFPLPSDPFGTNVLTFYTNVLNSTFTVAGLAPPSPTEAHGRITFLTEAQARAFYAKDGPDLNPDPDINFDLDLDGLDNETEAPSPVFTCFPVRIEVRWLSDNHPRMLDVTTILYSNDR
ncbi:MAG: prepilin-type N-terminal cleavage/methylation domain-containing protein [Actinobacteria bacterium]|nr:prepilin-type N-terminal cleavage/methylation domain-containing protein [Actinomycetota bacterium]